MSVQKRVRGGQVRWVGRYRGPDSRERSKTFDTQREAKAWVAERLREMRHDDWIDPNAQTITLGQLWADWEKSATNSGTKRVREQIGTNLGALRDVELGRLRPTLIREWRAGLLAGRAWADGKPLAESTVKNYCGQVGGCLQRAVDDGLLRKSPMPKVEGGRRMQPVRTAELLSVEQLWALVDAASDFPTLARMMVVSAATGLRAGEIGGLRVRSIDFLRKEIDVCEQAEADTTEFAWRGLKTDGSLRTIPLPKIAIDTLAEELAARPVETRDMPVFRTRGDGMWSSTAIGKAINARRRKAGLDDAVTWHSLRHFYASTLIQAGASVKTVQERLGHSSPTTTLEVYTHLWPGEDERTRAAVDSILMRDERGTDPQSEAGGTSV
ncbi:tyrosine-type recombinase/integrase [Rhodococcus sp. NPDC058532]|uniref:tyrosine-type recombinase/integrase n=1 Tax=Rhodococcus sp. NPDC058532 TaxID=3346540 RepID=UPI003651FEDB